MAVHLQESTGLAMEDVPAGDRCRRCGGLTVPEIFPDMEAGRGATVALRCVQCGDVIDHIILTNRLRNRRGSMSVAKRGVEQFQL